MIESIDGDNYLCFLEGMTGARLTIGACITKGPSTDTTIADGVIREEIGAERGRVCLLKQVSVADEVVKGGLSRSKQADGPNKHQNSLNEVDKSWKGRLGSSEESWLTSFEVLDRILVEGVAVGSRRWNRDFHDGATRGCASGDKEIQRRRIREIDEIEHECGRFMQTRREKTRFRVEVRIVEDGTGRLGRGRRGRREGATEKERQT